jgi:hypothetical protein
MSETDAAEAEEKAESEAAEAQAEKLKPLSIDQLAAAFDEKEGAPAAEDDPGDDDADAQAQKFPAPQSWAREDHKAWNDLPSAAQKVLAKREADRDRAVADAATKAGRAAAEAQHLAEAFKQLTAQAKEEATILAETWRANWGNVDWPRLAREDPNLYVEQKALADDEREYVLEAFRRQQAAQDRQHAAQETAARSSELVRQQYVNDQVELLQELSPELCDPDKGSERCAKTTEFLLGFGFTREMLNDISAAELSIAYDAMRWRDAQKAAKSQAAQPRKNPIATAKPAPPGAGAAVTPTNRDVQAASQRLTRTGKVDDLVALFDAEDAAKARKAG